MTTSGSTVVARLAALRGFLVAAAAAALDAARRMRARRRQRQAARATYDALRHLDDRALHDLGFERSEMTSVAAEVTGEAERTRMRARLTAHMLPL